MAEVKLPELPACWTYEHPVRLYTADQMQAYARACVEANRAVVTDEMVERALLCLYPGEYEQHLRDAWNDTVRAALTAALGKEA